MRRRGVLALGALLPGAVLAQPHWLVGRWEGKVTAGIGREGPDRVLVVRSVAPDGTVTGTWSTRGGGGSGGGGGGGGGSGGGGGNADMRLDGETLKVVSGRGLSYTLRRSGPDRLEGDYLGSGGRSYPGGIWLERAR